MRFARRAAALLTGLVFAFAAHADATIPARDISGVRDNPLLKRYEGSFIVSAEVKAFTDMRMPLSRLELTDRTDSSNNHVFAPVTQKELEGALTRLVYVAPASRSPLEVLRNYEDEVKLAGGDIVFTCKDESCGGDATRASGGGGGNSSLMQYFLMEKDIKDAAFSNGRCALDRPISDQRYTTARIPQANGEAWIAIHTYQLVDDLYCKALNGRTIAVIHILEPKARDQKMVVVSADAMAKSLGASGKIALYGIFFDTNKTDIKPESAPTLAEIAALMKADSKLAVLIVGHTDSVGGFDYNVDLSKRRAEAVTALLAKSYGVPPARLRAAGVGMMAPSASNDAEEGRARNRRVELVKLN